MVGQVSQPQGDRPLGPNSYFVERPLSKPPRLPLINASLSDSDSPRPGGLGVGSGVGVGGASTLESVIDALRTDPATSRFLDLNITPEEQVGAAVREHRVADTLHHANRAVDILAANVRDQVIRRKEALLAEVDAVNALEKEVASVSSAVDSLSSASNALSDALSTPYLSMTKALRTLQNTRDAQALARALVRFRFCSRKLREAALFPSFSAAVKTPPDTLPPAAEAVRELEDLLGSSATTAPPGFDKIDVVAKSLSSVRRAGPELRRRLSVTLNTGIATRDQRLIAAAVTAFHTLGVLSERVNGEVGRLLSETQAAIQRGLDPPRSGPALSISAALSNVGVGGITKESWNPAASLGDSRSTILSQDASMLLEQPVSGENSARGSSADAWDKLDDVLDAIQDSCAKAVLLQQVLSRKYDDVTHLSLLHEPIASAFIDAVSKAVSDQVAALSRSHRQRSTSNHTFRLICADYPRLRSALMTMSGRIYAMIRVSPYPVTAIDSQGKFPIIPTKEFISNTLVNAVREVETQYLTTSLERLTSAVTEIFDMKTRYGPGEAEALGILRLMAAELSGSRECPDLFQTSVVNVSTALRLYSSHVEDFAAANAPDADTLGTRASVLMEWHLLNVYNGMIALTSSGRRVLGANNDGGGAVPPAIDKELCAMSRLASMLVDGPFLSCVDNIDRTLRRIHTEDLTTPSNAEEECSLYMMDIAAQLSMFADGVLQKLARSRALGLLTVQTASHILDQFVLHATLVFPLPESARHRLVTDMARLELAIENFCPAKMLGKSYLAIRSLRNLVLYSDDDLGSATGQVLNTLSGLKPSQVAYHIFSRASDKDFVHPHRRHNLTPQEFTSWYQKHSEEEAWTGILELVESYETSDMQLKCSQYDVMRSLVFQLRRFWEQTQRS